MGVSAANAELIRLLEMRPNDQEKYLASLPPDRTSTVLVEHLQKKPQSTARDEIIRKAKKYYYDDFKSLLEPCPKIYLHRDLEEAGFHDLAQEVIKGSYD